MICDVCLEDAKKVINIFNKEGIRLRIPSIIGKHFWFEPSEDNPAYHLICISCWERLINFHMFYTSVKEAHKNLKNDYKLQKPDSDGTAYSINDTEDETPTHDKDAVCNTVKDAEGIGSATIKCEQADFGLIEDARLFIQREHEALLDEYTYIEPTISELLLDLSELPNLETYSKPPSFIEESFCNRNSILNNYVKRSKRIELKKRFDQEKRCSNEDKLIRKYINLKCEICFVKQETFTELNLHYQLTHQISGYVRCCGKKLPTRSYILDHINQHINPEKYACKECNKTFSTQYAIKNHLAIKHAPESSKVYKCDECSQRFTNDYSLNKHLLQHKNDDEKQLYCTDCGKMLSSIQCLEKHRNIHHKRMNGHICHVCGIVLKGKKAFGKHIREHAAILGSDAINDPVCPICGKLSASIKTLRHHIRYVHSAMRPHKCPVCGKGFKIRQKLKEHLGTHAVGVSLPCPYCPKRFRSKIHVYSHKYRMHKKECEMERNARA